MPSLRPAIEEEVREAVALEPGVNGWSLRLQGGEHDPTNHAYEAVVAGTAGSVPFEVCAPLVVHVQRSTCTRCGRRAGGYYESIVQLRAQGRALEPDEVARAGEAIDRVLADLHRHGDLDSFLVKGEEVKGGFDFYLGTVHAGRAIGKALAQEMGALVRETASLVGRGKDGIDLYRVTVSTKLPHARVGGFVALEGRLHLVASMGPKVATLLDLEDHRRRARPRADLDDAATVAPREAGRAVVVSESERELQLLDPWTLRTVDVVRPPGFPAGRASVRVVRSQERLWLLPADDKLT
jgi:nonsense-mediated mRNA decay protein 3